ncbi:MAG: PAS domain S-box protein [Syntrophobacteraceae bacterium]
MADGLRILILEDRKEDVKLMERELRAAVMTFETAVVESEAAYAAGIDHFHPHVILADDRLPTFDGMVALEMARERCPDIPFIFVSGTIGEDRAIETLKQGATDYVLKARLSRLAPVVQRALREAETRTLKWQSEQDLRESEARFRTTFEAAAVGIAQVSPEGRWLWMNRKLSEIVGYSKAELLDRTYRDITHPGDLEANVKLVEQILAGATDTSSFEKRYVRKDGAVVWANITTSLTREPDGRPKFFISVVEDITERKLAEELIRVRLSLLDFAVTHSLDELLQRTLDDVCALTHSPIGFYHFVEPDQATLSLQAWSTATVRDFCKAEGKGLHYPIEHAGVWVDCVHDRRPVIHNDYAVLPHRKGMPPGHAPVTRELVVPILRAERIVAILGVGNKPTDYGEKDVEVVSYLADVAWEIAVRKQAEEALKESQEFKNAVLDSMPSHISVLDPDGVILAVNEPWARFSMDNATALGAPACRTGVGVNYLDVCRESHGELSEEAMAAHDGIQTVLDGSLASFTLEYPCHSPTQQRWFLMTVTPLGRRERGVVISHSEITARKQAEEERLRVEPQLRQAQKMEALGTLAGGIAHDFNNILGIIMGYTEMARLEAGEDGSLLKELQQVTAAAHRAKDLVQQILAFSRRREQERQPVQPSLLVKEVLKMLRASLPSTIEIKSKVVSKSVVMADPTQIHQVLMNLCTNAAHAMQENGGVLDVSLSDVAFMPDGARPFGLDRGPHVQLVVKDSGHGIAPEILDRIFDPFFTTKEHGEGTGLGLSVVHGIVKGYGGAVEVDSAPGNGTSFKVFFPAREDMATVHAEKRASMPRGSERLMLVEDEPLLGAFMKRMLERLGYEVDYRSNGLEALEAFRHQSAENPVRLVITDMTMPHLTGMDLARELLRIQPDLPIVLCTGFSEKITPEKARNLGIRGFLMKPVAATEMAELIREMLDHGPPGRNKP